jgi:hypothetical protein
MVTDMIDKTSGWGRVRRCRFLVYIWNLAAPGLDNQYRLKTSLYKKKLAPNHTALVPIIISYFIPSPLFPIAENQARQQTTD